MFDLSCNWGIIGTIINKAPLNWNFLWPQAHGKISWHLTHSHIWISLLYSIFHHFLIYKISRNNSKSANFTWKISWLTMIQLKWTIIKHPIWFTTTTDIHNKPNQKTSDLDHIKPKKQNKTIGILSPSIFITLQSSNSQRRRRKELWCARDWAFEAVGAWVKLLHGKLICYSVIGQSCILRMR